MAKRKKTVHGAVIGYGPAFNMGKAHCGWINDTEGLEIVAVCDLDPARMVAAAADFPGIATYTDVAKMLQDDGIDLVTVVTPHNTHAPLAIQCLKAGKHVILEKPMCITGAEATEMIHAAKESGVMLSVFHNRRHDGDYAAIKEVVDKGLIGDVFQVETGGGGYGKPGNWWRSDKRISGGAFYDWGAHFVDWVLNLVPGKVVGVTGFFHNLVWHEVTNEDHVHAVIRFDSGAVADVQLSQIARIGRPRWRILGTKGAILDTGGGSFTVSTVVEGIETEMTVKYKQGDWPSYYTNIAAHLIRGEELEVKPEEGRRVIAVIETAEKSAASGKTEPVPYE
ncbi:MAG: Gfo/Idh/MocA family oxidoreductase [Candidatus Latescibacterota bacterium]